MTGLQYLVDMEPSKSAVSDGLPPGEDRRVWSPTASTLTHGVGDAVLVDAAYEDAQALERGRVRQEDGKCYERPENSATRVLVNGPIAVIFAPSRD